MSLFVEIQHTKARIERDKRLKQESLEQELLKQLDKKKSASTDLYTVKKDVYTTRFLDTQRQQDALEKMLQHYRLYNFDTEVREFIKSLSRYEPDYYSIKITSEFIDRIITKYCETHRYKLDESKK
jgi:mannosyltransferase OCH1-like enzyme